MLELQQRVAYRLQSLLAETGFKRSAYYSVGRLTDDEYVVMVAPYTFGARKTHLVEALPGTTDIQHYFAAGDGSLDQVTGGTGRWNPKQVEYVYRVSLKALNGQLEVKAGEAEAYRHNDLLSLVTAISFEFADVNDQAILRNFTKWMNQVAPERLSEFFPMYMATDRRAANALPWVVELCHEVHRKFIPGTRLLTFPLTELELDTLRGNTPTTGKLTPATIEAAAA